MNVIKTNNTQDRVRQLQRKLYQSTKRSRARKFHALYDKLYREDVLYRGWNDVKANKGSAGIDEQTIEDIESYGVDKVILEIQEELKEGRYKGDYVLDGDIKGYFDQKKLNAFQGVRMPQAPSETSIWI